MGKECSMQRRCLGSRVVTNNSFFDILKCYEMFCTSVLCTCCDPDSRQRRTRYCKWGSYVMTSTKRTVCGLVYRQVNVGVFLVTSERPFVL